jgi:hypothetical protein
VFNWNNLTLRLNSKNRSVIIKSIIMVSTLATISNPQRAWGGNDPIEELNNRLISAVLINNFALVRSSITAGANPKATNKQGLTAAGLAVEKGYFNIAHYILGVLKQKHIAKEESTRIISGELNKNTPDNSTTNLINEKIQLPTPTPAPKPLMTLEPKIYKKWPENSPNPFSPSTQPKKSLPIMGTIHKQSVKPTTQGQTIILNPKAQNSTNSPLKTPDTAVLRDTNGPTPILPLGKQPHKKITPKDATNLKYEKEKADQEEKFEEEDLFDKIWNKINKKF